MAQLPNSKEFHFYCGIGAPLPLKANSLHDFCDKIKQVDAGSIEFHMNRGDFEAWFKCLGDEELAKKTALLKKKGLSGEKLREKMYGVAEARCNVLTAMLAQTSA